VLDDVQCVGRATFTDGRREVARWVGRAVEFPATSELPKNGLYVEGLTRPPGGLAPRVVWMKRHGGGTRSITGRENTFKVISREEERGAEP
jgi:hypothetical protein